MESPAASLLSWAALTDQGRRRQNNEDAWGVFAVGDVLARPPAEPRVWPRHGFLLIVSDGMGGARAGEVASAFCVQRLAEECHARRTRDRRTAMREAFLTTHDALTAESDADPAKQGMGATLSALWVGPAGDAVLGHVGDSHIYRQRGAERRLVTEDHSVGAGMVRRGELTAEAATRMKFRSLLEQAMGGDGAPIHPQVEALDWEPEDEWLFCSDGLYGPLGDRLDAEWTEARRRPTLAAGAQALVDAANAAGGPDNITVLLARFVPENQG